MSNEAEDAAHLSVLKKMFLGLLYKVDQFYATHGADDPNWETPYPFIGIVTNRCDVSMPDHGLLASIAAGGKAADTIPKTLRMMTAVSNAAMAFVVTEGFALDATTRARKYETIVVSMETMDGGAAFATARIDRSGDSVELNWEHVRLGINGAVLNSGKMSGYFEKKE